MKELRSSRALVALIAIVALALSACGESDGGRSTPNNDASSDGTVSPESQLETSEEVSEEVREELGAEALLEPGPEVLTDELSPEVTTPDLPETGDSTTSELPLPGFGAIAGDCGVLDDAAWGSSAPAFFVNHLDFKDDPYDEEDYELLSAGGQKILDDGNAGGSSIASELFAYEVLHRCELATLLKTETEILYTDEEGKITDLLVWLDERNVGVSVTRAVGWPQDAPYTSEQATELLAGKLQGVLDSSANVAPQDAWARQILHILAFGDAHATRLEAAWQSLDEALRADTFVIVTVTDGDDGFIY